jgi:hypothetical protein
LVHSGDENLAPVLAVDTDVAPSSEAVRVHALFNYSTSPFAGYTGASSSELCERVRSDITGGGNKSRVMPKIIQDLSAFSSRAVLFPIKSSFGQTKNIDIVVMKSLAEIFEVDEIISCAYSVGILEVNSQMVLVFGAKKISPVVIGKFSCILGDSSCRMKEVERLLV